MQLLQFVTNYINIVSRGIARILEKGGGGHINNNACKTRQKNFCPEATPTN